MNYLRMLLLPCLLGVSLAVQAEEPFIAPVQDDTARPTAAEAWEPGAVQSVEIAPERLQASEFSLVLPDGTRLRALASETEALSSDGWSWRGALFEGERLIGSGTFTARGGRVTGQFSGPDGRHRLAPDPVSGHRLQFIDRGDLPEDICLSELAPAVDTPRTGTGERTSQAGFPADESEDPPLIDVMVLYTPQAVQDLGGKEETRLEALNTIAAANTAAEGSELEMRFRTVNLRPWDLEEAEENQWQDLNELLEDDELDALRDEYGADLVALLGHYTDFCGVAWVKGEYDEDFPLNYSLNSTAFDGGCLSIQVVAHEMGHNMGLHHDPENAPPPGDAIEPFAFGHFVDLQFRTVMSYDTECTNGNCPLIDNFSNPDVMDPGDSGYETGIADERDNARVLEKTAPYVEQFRDREMSLGEAVDLEGLDWTSGGDGSIWVGREVDEIGRAVSGELAEGEEVWFEAAFDEGEWMFEWRRQGEAAGTLRVERNGELIYENNDNAGEWTTALVETEDDGDVLRWTFEPEDGADFGAARAELRQILEGEAETFEGRVLNAAGHPVPDAEIRLDGRMVTRSAGDGRFDFLAEAGLEDGTPVTVGGPGLEEETVDLADCEAGSGCEISVTGVSRSITGEIDGLLEGESVEIELVYLDADGNEQLVTTDTLTADGDGQAPLSLGADAAIDHEPLRVTGFGYEEDDFDFPDSERLREGDYDAFAVSLTPRVPMLLEAEAQERAWRGFTIDTEIDTNERDTDVVLRFGPADGERSGESIESVAAEDGEAAVEVSASQLECESDYDWEVEAVSDHGDSEGVSSGTLTTADCGQAFGCSMAGGGSRPDPVPGLLLLASLVGLVWRRWRP